MSLNQIFGVLPDEFGSDGIADAFGRGVAFVLRVEHDRAARFYDVAVCGSGGGEIDRIFGDLYLRFPPPPPFPGSSSLQAAVIHMLRRAANLK